MNINDILKKWNIHVDKNGRIKQCENPEFLKQVLELTTDEIVNMSEEMNIRISALKAPDGYKLVRQDSRVTEHYGTDLCVKPFSYKCKYILMKEQKYFEKLVEQLNKD